METEINTTLPDLPQKLPDQLTDESSPPIEIPDITPLLKTSEIIDDELTDYNESLNNLVTKYAKI